MKEQRKTGARIKLHTIIKHPQIKKLVYSPACMHACTCMCTYLPVVATDDVVSVIDVEGGSPPLMESITDQLEVTWSTVVFSMGEHCAVQIAKVLCGYIHIAI